jgi:indole-3-glycerol phosphate synthase
MTQSENYLTDIGAWTRGEVSRRQRTRPFGTAFPGGRLGVIAEIKRASPSEGAIAPDLDPAEVARRYEAGGASAISVLTSPRDFGGSLADLEAVRAAVDLPLLCKDFIVDPWQVTEARAHGADAVLLILALVDDGLARDIIAAAEEHHMDVLCEVHDVAELRRALDLACPIIGVNARNLTTMQVDRGEQRRLLRSIPGGFVVVAESGIATPADAKAARAAGAHAVLVGTALMRDPDLLPELVRA